MLFFGAYYIWFDLAISGLLHHTENMSIESKTAFGTVSVKVIAAAHDRHKCIEMFDDLPLFDCNTCDT
jgi:hypothetical protein